MERAIVKTVAGFFNARGGTLVVGVNDAGLPVGLERDIATLGKRRDVDGYEQFLRNLLNNAIGKDRCAQVEVKFPWVDGVQVCVIKAPSAVRPVFVHEGGAQSFYVRSGHTTQSFGLQQMHEYCATRFA